MKSLIARIGSLMAGVSLLVPVDGSADSADPSSTLRIATFEVDATPPIGSPLAYETMEYSVTPLSCRGVVLIGAELPIVLCAVDWIGIGNGGQDVWKQGLAEGAGTTPDRVAVHTLHQHEAPRCDFSANALLAEQGLNGARFDPIFTRRTIARAADAIRKAIEHADPVTHIGLGEAEVKKVASNRRILGPDGKVETMRWTSTSDPEVRAEPVGTIDPTVSMVSFWNNDEPLAALTYYATHPQSYYRTGGANPDFPGLARNRRQATTETPHVHFNGAGGNIGAGKWNDGSPKYRDILARRLADGMKRAWEATETQPISADEVAWNTDPVVLPPADHLEEKALERRLRDEDRDPGDRGAAAKALTWLRRCQSGDPIQLGCLRLGEARILHMPGELAVEYQLAAKEMRPDGWVAMAAYGDYAPGYICLEEHYEQGGYEASARASRVAPEVESTLMQAMERLLQADPAAAP